MGIRVVLDFSCFVLPQLVLPQSKIGLDFCLEGLESLTLGDRGRVILPLDVRLVLGIEGFSDLLVILVESVFMRSGFCSKDFLCSLGDCILEGGSFLGTGFGGQAFLELFIERFLELSQADRILQSSDVVGGPDSLGSVSMRWSDVQRTALTSLWSVQHSAPLMARVTLTSLMSRWRTMMKTIMCQCFDLGCIQVVLYLSANLNKVLEMQRLCFAHLLRRSWPLSLTLPTPCLPRTPSQLLCSFPTLALKSPSTTSLSLSGLT